MARKENPIIVESVEFDYVGTDEQFNTFLKSIIKAKTKLQHYTVDKKGEQLKSCSPLKLKLLQILQFHSYNF